MMEKIENDFTNAKYKEGEFVAFEDAGKTLFGQVKYHYKGSYFVSVLVDVNKDIMYEIKEEDIMSGTKASHRNKAGAKDPREPAHYDMQISPVEFIEKNKLGFSVGNIIKYVCRYKYKGGKEDLKKARHYIDLLLKYEYNETTNK